MVSSTATTVPLIWENATSVPPLIEGEVHIWRCFPDNFSGDIFPLLDQLDETEAARATKFRFEEDFRRFVLRRVFLRRLLAAYEGRPASDLRYATGPQGKPSLNTAASDSGLGFNTSHSNGLAVVAVTKGIEIGVDVERIRDNERWNDLAQRFFSSAEAAALAAYERERRSDAFFAGWTRKEAFIKALGGGLAIPLDLFTVTLDPEGEACVVATSPEMGPAEDWQLLSFAPGSGAAGALAYRGKARKVRFLSDAVEFP